ncbi:MAG TPA: hypothetical protein VFJ16_18305 [Longimicrobium sp.]|nr:hypothetical protein [Longimicrobium sp.]
MRHAAQVHREIAGFLAENMTPATLVAFRPSDAAQRRVSDLIFREKNEGLTREETEELDAYMGLEHVMRLAKAMAHRRLREQNAHQR